MNTIWFWQTILTPHMAGLAAALVARGVEVHYVAEKQMALDRQRMGWRVPSMPGVKVHLASGDQARTALVASAHTYSIHICQGIRGNGYIAHVQRLLARRALRQWVVMETVDDSGWQGWLKRLEYRRLFALRRRSLAGVLANGYRTTDWVVARGFNPQRVFPFAYFLPDVNGIAAPASGGEGFFRFLFVGQLIERKRVDWLIRALESLYTSKFELVVVGSGPLEESLRNLADVLLPGRTRWLGTQSSTEISAIMVNADCLVLPSRHDGWGAVVSEALMVGTPAVCSDACGSAGVVHASKMGGVFPVDDFSGLCGLLDVVMRNGRINQPRRTALADWARCLGADRGAKYLLDIVQGNRTAAPWNASGMGGVR